MKSTRVLLNCYPIGKVPQLIVYSGLIIVMLMTSAAAPFRNILGLPAPTDVTATVGLIRVQMIGGYLGLFGL